MRLGLNIGYSRSQLGIDLSLVQHADRLGFHSVWSAEAYGSDAVSPLCWIAAQHHAHQGRHRDHADPGPHPDADRDHRADDRPALGRPLPPRASASRARRSWRAGTAWPSASRCQDAGVRRIVRMVWRRERPVEHKGEYYQIPYAGPDATGLGKPLKSILHGRADIPIYLAAIGPRNVALAAEIADGLLPVFFSPERMSVFTPSLEAGFKAAGGGKSLARFDVAPTVPIVLGPDAAACRAMVKPRLALYVGGMGARGKNFYNELVTPLRLRGRRQAHPGSLPGRQEGRGGRRGARRARGRGRAVRAEGADPRAAAALEELRHHHADLRRGPGGGARADGGAGALGA